MFIYPRKGLYFSAGLFDDHSTELPYDPGGDLYITEEGWQREWGGHPYKIQLGAWRDTGSFQRFLGGVAHHATGAYVVASGKLWKPSGASDRGLGLFLQLGAAPPAVALVERHYGAGLVRTGLSAVRPNDEIGIAFSDGILTTQNDFTYQFEKEYQAYYQIQVRPDFTVQPDLEYWQHPNGTDQDTLLFLVRLQYNFGPGSA